MRDLNELELRRTLAYVEDRITDMLCSYTQSNPAVFNQLRERQNDIAAELRRRKSNSLDYLNVEKTFY
tara:strand:+ start:695 stop:898 length:204 start_codon:yes stop_codon:yes gene_type:complete